MWLLSAADLDLPNDLLSSVPIGPGALPPARWPIEKPGRAADLLADFSADTISYANLDGSGGADPFTAGATLKGLCGVVIDPTLRRAHWANTETHTIAADGDRRSAPGSTLS